MRRRPAGASRRSRNEVYDRISQVYNVRKADYETERIARTEMIKAANMGAQEGMRQSGRRGAQGLAGGAG
jgi:hypothetical protein